MNRRASCFFLLAALLWLGGLPALALRPQPLETRVGGCEAVASGQTSAADCQSPENAMVLGHCGYKSASGRLKWLNQDPIGEDGGINLYRFVGNNPVNFVDPYGLLDYYYSSGGSLQPSGPVPYLEGDSWFGQLGSAVYNAIPVAYNGINNLLAPSDVGTVEGTASGNGDYLGMLAAAGIDAAGMIPGEGSGAKLGKPSLTACKKALTKVQNEVGKLPKGKPGKFGSPQAGTPKLGYRLDPAHPDAPAGSPESQPHFNWWDWTNGKKGSGGRYGAIPIE